ncbi:hypothetical protein B0H16DRAFT_1894865 [Mycena metata]|uniref:F-box domain-containing protein n=1 Tax=Mycena metata TaxID=1033252 RepID=A0AAD7H6Y5_9AGAR|nr:hypothetical protein B0H16DRAFT_1899530 [Mycena metata]KAJ7725732.1 hypothetical protein B0H16DRAFT_1698285 [Mycena metata]KAJ7726249.1 hypothetical protein B0H16DRAFT_1894865 [Mycena metata]
MMETAPVVYYAKVPTEIWGRCWSQCTPQELASLVLVSRYFRQLCQPLLFERQSISARDTPRSIHGHITRSITRLEKLASTTHLSSVKSWTFSSRKPPSTVLTEKSYQRLLRVFTSTLGKCENLRSLHLFSVTIDETLQKTLLELERLTELKFDACDLAAWTGWTGPLLSVEEFQLVDEEYFRQTPVVKSLNIVSGDSVRVLTLEGLEISLSLLSAFAMGGSQAFQNLATLSLQLWDALMPTFLALLARCPELSHLEISRSAVSAPPNEPLPATTIPLLRSFSGPRFLAAFFISGRPVHEMELFDGGGYRPRNTDADKDILVQLADIARACPALQSLSITSPIVDCLRITACIAAHWPGLHELCFVLRNSAGVRPPSITGLLDFSDSDDEVDEGGLNGGDASSLYDDGSGSEDSQWDWASDPYAADIMALSEGTPLSAKIANALQRAEGSDVESEFSDPEAVLPEFDTVSAVPLPEVLVPGSLYTTAGAFPPPQAVAVPAPPAQQPSFATLIDAICVARVSIFTHLESLRFTRGDDGITPASVLPMSDQHRAVLALERQLPRLREVEFDDVVWRSEKGGTWSQRPTRAIIASLVGREA